MPQSHTRERALPIADIQRHVDDAQREPCGGERVEPPLRRAELMGDITAGAKNGSDSKVLFIAACARAR
jgi:hypothetical protein